MSHFIRCDRCDKQDAVLGNLSLPPGWQNICHADLCEPCCLIVRDFIRFKVSDAARLPVEPIEETAPLPPVGDKLFETAPEAPQVSADSQMVSEHASNGKLVPEGQSFRGGLDHATAGEPAGKTQPASAESSTEERARTRKAKAKMQGQDTILPDPRKLDEPRPGEPGVH